MKDEEFKNLSTGDIVRNKEDSKSYVVTANYGNRVTAVRTTDLTNPREWRLLFKAKQEHQSIFDKKEEGPWRPMTTGEVLQEGDAWSEIGMGYLPIKPDMIGKTVDAEYLMKEFGGGYFTKRS